MDNILNKVKLAINEGLILSEDDLRKYGFKLKKDISWDDLSRIIVMGKNMELIPDATVFTKSTFLNKFKNALEPIEINWNGIIEALKEDLISDESGLIPFGAKLNNSKTWKDVEKAGKTDIKVPMVAGVAIMFDVNFRKEKLKDIIVPINI